MRKKTRRAGELISGGKRKIKEKRKEIEMQVDFLKGIVENIAGKQATEIVDLLFGRKDVNEFLIAKKLKLTINQTRNILYKLSDHGIVSFTRKKDKRKGWYIYFWTLDIFKSIEILEKKILLEIEQLKNQLRNRETKRFYSCRTCNVEIGEETALLNHFTCAECGQVYSLSESENVIKDLENRITKKRKIAEMIKEEKEKIKQTKEKGKKPERKAKKEKRKLSLKSLRKRNVTKKKDKKKAKKKIKKLRRKNERP